MPMASTRKLTPCKNPGKLPKMRRGWPEMMSKPTAANTKPMRIEKMVFGMSSPPRPMKVANASTISANSSGGPNLSANAANGGANSVNSTTEMLPPTNDATAAADNAWSALPCCASGRPSNTVATAVDAPGIPKVIELMAPPYIAP